MFFSYPSARIRVILRPKLGGGGDHYAVAFPGGSVVELSGNGVRHISYREFEHGLPVKEAYVAPIHLTAEILERVQEALSRPHGYRFLVWNCEHFANWIVGRPAESTQINGLVLLGLGFACLRALA